LAQVDLARALVASAARESRMRLMAALAALPAVARPVRVAIADRAAWRESGF
jgi:hypothetical protein